MAPMVLAFQDLSYSIRSKGNDVFLLQGISAFFLPGRMVSEVQVPASPGPLRSDSDSVSVRFRLTLIPASVCGGQWACAHRFRFRMRWPMACAHATRGPRKVPRPSPAPTASAWRQRRKPSGREGAPCFHFAPVSLSQAALMGPSGAGKSTLLDAIAGRKTQGQLTYASLVFGTKKPSRGFLKRHTGYVEVQPQPFFLARTALRIPAPSRVTSLSRTLLFLALPDPPQQFDTLVPSLTVEEMLRYTAELKRPEDEPSASKSRRSLVADLSLLSAAQRGPSFLFFLPVPRMSLTASPSFPPAPACPCLFSQEAAVNDILEKLSLVHVRGNKIGDALERGISGGQVRCRSPLFRRGACGAQASHPGAGRAVRF